MKTHTAQLLALLNTSNQVLIADLLTLTTVTGTVYRYTNADIDLTWDGQTYVADEILFKRGSIRCVEGIELDTLSLSFYALPANLIGTVPFLQAVATGALDGAYVDLQRVYTSSWTSLTGVVRSFIGRISDVEAGRTHAEITVKPETEILNTKMPRNLYQPGCVHTLYDGGCGLSKNSFSQVFHVAIGSTSSILYSEDGYSEGYFALGTIEFTTGDNSGVKRSIKSYDSGIIGLSYPLPYTPTIGDTFIAYAGCDKLQSTCLSKFNNLANFRGFPYIPVPETSV